MNKGEGMSSKSVAGRTEHDSPVAPADNRTTPIKDHRRNHAEGPAVNSSNTLEHSTTFASPVMELSGLLEQCEQLSAAINDRQNHHQQDSNGSNQGESDVTTFAMDDSLPFPLETTPATPSLASNRHATPVEDLVVERVAEYQGLDSGGRFTEKPFEDGGGSRKSVAQRLRAGTVVILVFDEVDEDASLNL